MGSNADREVNEPDTSRERDAADEMTGHSDAALTEPAKLGQLVAERLGTTAEAAVAAVIDLLKSDPELMGDPKRFFAVLEHTLQEQLGNHGVEVPPEGFDKLEGVEPSLADSSPKQPPAPTSEGPSAGSPPILSSFPTVEVEALEVWVLTRAMGSAQEDLRAVTEKVNALNDAKARTRETLNEREKAAHSGGSGDVSAIGEETLFQPGIVPNEPNPQEVIDNEIAAKVDDIDGQIQESEIESLRLQMSVDRLRALMSSLSNRLSVTSETASNITSNLK